MKKQCSLKKSKNSKPSTRKNDLLEDLRNMIDRAKRSVATVVNTHLTALNWQMGRRIHTEILQEKRADYGKEIIATLSRELTKEYGTGFKEASLWRMVQFAELFPDRKCLDESFRSGENIHLVQRGLCPRTPGKGVPLATPNTREQLEILSGFLIYVFLGYWGNIIVAPLARKIDPTLQLK